MKAPVLAFSLLALAPALAVAAMAPPGTVQQRGDFFYDANGEMVGAVHRDLPEGFERRPMSHLEKLSLMGLRLPDRATTLVPRKAHAKPARVVARKGLHANLIEVKFVEGVRVRMRGGELTALEGDVRAFRDLLRDFPEAKLRRLHSVEERILDENKEAGERLTGKQLPDLNNWYFIEFPEGSERGVELANRLNALPIVETAYLQEESFKPDHCTDDPPATPNYQGSQNYLNAAPDGVDALYAWSYHAGGNGAGVGFWVVDCEWEWCYAHEDLPITVADVINGSTGADTSSMNHGTAVLGVYAGCDNGYGVTGISHDINAKMADRDSETSWAANIGAADAVLLAGEVMLLEVHIGGPDSGLPCPCNCSQFELVPVEWNQAAFDAISTATASGVVVVEAAGNGSMDLDNAIYGGAFDLGTRDSRAILVGAGSNNGHAPMCWTNYGSRVDVHGYGESVRTAGYGGGSDTQADCMQSYTGTFSGTSSASPIITGVCAALQGIANAKYGYDLSATQMRNRIKVGATPQAASPKNIGPMPDLFDAINGIEPDVAEDFRAGWTGPIVGRTTADATGASAVIEAAAFPGNASGPYWSWTTQNYSSYSPTVNEPNTRLYMDDVALVDCNHPNFAVLESRYCANWDQTATVKGGRHTMRMLADWNDVEQESNEANNDFARQFIWTGLALGLDAPVTRTYDPEAITTGYVWFNAEGFSGATGANFMHAFAVMPLNSGDDFDIRLNTEVPANEPTAGFGAYLAYSSDPAGQTDFVLVDKYEEPAGTYYASVLNFTGTGSKVVEWDGDQGLVANPGTTGPFTIGSGDILELHQVSLNAAAGEYRIHVDVTAGTADIGVSVYPTTGTDGFWAKSETEPGGYADDVAGTGDEFCIVDPTVGGVFAIAVWKVGSSERLESVTYNIVISQVPNLVADTPAGWYGPIVPRNTTDANAGSAPLPATLTGNAATTSYNWTTYNQGPNTADPGAGVTWGTRIFLDDASIFLGQLTGALGSGSFVQWMNTPQGLAQSNVRGGRHYLRTDADDQLEIVEFDETDNTFVDWFVWTPYPLLNQVPVSRLAPPDATPLGYSWFAVDGFRGTPPPPGQPWWMAVGIIPLVAGNDYDIRAHDASAGSKDGFGANYALSSDAAGLSDFSIINYHLAAKVARDFGVFNASAGAGNFNIQRADGYLAGTVQLGDATGPVLGPFTIHASDVLDFHEIYVPAGLNGVPMIMTLNNLSGNADLGVAIYDFQVQYNSKLGYLVNANANGPGQYEQTGLFSLEGDQYYGLAVYKKGSGDLGDQNTYQIHFSRGSLIGAEAEKPTTFALFGGYPNPFSAQATVNYAVPASGGRVTVAIYGLDGRRVKTLADGEPGAGRFTVAWDGTDDQGASAPAGIYFVRLDSQNARLTRKITFLP